MKLQVNEILTKEFLKEIQKDWNEATPLINNNLKSIKTIIDDSNVKLNKFEEFNDYGEYDFDFLYVLHKLLMVQEKKHRRCIYVW
ncbi:MAG: hypothetical protein RSD06_01245 [Bacilli bacterium]